MAFCANCGTKMDDGVKFCPSCGTRAAGGGDAGGTVSTPRPRSVTVGQVKKCPSCGAPVESFQMRCESCGVELKNTEVSSTLTSFIEQVNRFDVEIVQEKEKINPRKTGKLVLWVILNIFTYCIPLIVRTIKRVVFPPNPHLIPLEQRKKSFIENYAVPNNREDIVEFVLFASTKVDSMMDHTGRSMADIGAANMWGKVWSDKCKQVGARAGVVLTGDKNTLTTINNLMSEPKKLMRKAKIRELIKTGAIAAVAIAVGLVIYFNNSGTFIKVPEPKTVAANNVSFSALFGNYFRVAGNDVSIIPDPDGKGITLMLQIECIKAARTDIEVKTAEFIQSRGWENDNCTITGPSYPEMALADFRTKSSGSTRDIISSMLDMKEGDSMTVSFIMEASGSGGEQKKALAKLMAMPQFFLSAEDLTYQITNKTKEEKNEAGYFDFLRL
jgi:hypothetical protein